MKISINENNYISFVIFDGNPYIDECENVGIEAPIEIPDDFYEKFLAYKLLDNALIFDAEKWAEIEAEREAAANAPTMNERMSAVEAAVLEMVLGGMVNG